MTKRILHLKTYRAHQAWLQYNQEDRRARAETRPTGQKWGTSSPRATHINGSRVIREMTQQVHPLGLEAVCQEHPAPVIGSGRPRSFLVPRPDSRAPRSRPTLTPITRSHTTCKHLEKQKTKTLSS
jgi:hypothetical protein